MEKHTSFARQPFIRRSIGTALTIVISLTALLVIGCDLLDFDEPIDSLANPLLRVFRGRLTYPTGEAPYDVLVGDLNRDGLPDVVTLDWETTTASVLLANDAGGYSEPTSFDLGNAPRAAVLADLSGDGILDVAVVNEENAQVTLMFGDGEGGFEDYTVINLASGSNPRALVAADISNNGILDLVTADTGTATVTLLIGEGNGNFLEPLSVPVEHAPAGLWAGDLTGNGIADIVTANPDGNTLAILEGTGIDYLPAKLLPCGYMPYLVEAADLNNNGMRDLIVGNAGSGDLSVLHALGDGTFSEERRFAFPHPIGRFVVADLSGNTTPDIAALLFDKTSDDRQPISRFAVMHGDGAGGFDAPAVYGSGWHAFAIAAADLNKNGRLDLITADYTTDTVSIAYNRGRGLFESDRRFPVGSRPETAAIADLNQDGNSDLAVLNVDNNTISLLAGNGDGTFDALTPILLPGKPLAMAAGDVNNDGKSDIVVTFTRDARAAVYFGTGAGIFAAPRFFPIQTDNKQGMPEAQSIALGDINNNGKLDIVTGNSNTDSVSVLINNGSGNFEAPIVSSVGNYPRNIHLVDTNDNGKLDLVFLSSRDPSSATDAAEPRVVRWFGNGDGTFDKDTHLRFATAAAPRMMAMGDVAGNGRMDAVTVHPGNNSVYVLTGQQNGRFAAATRVYMGYQPMAVTLADINRNGRADLVAILNSGSILVRFSRGELKFEAPNNFIVSKGMTKSLVADLNGNGLLDMVVLNIAQNDVGILLGREP